MGGKNSRQKKEGRKQAWIPNRQRSVRNETPRRDLYTPKNQFDGYKAPIADFLPESEFANDEFKLLNYNNFSENENVFARDDVVNLIPTSDHHTSSHNSLNHSDEQNSRSHLNEYNENVFGEAPSRYSSLFDGVNEDQYAPHLSMFNSLDYVNRAHYSRSLMRTHSLNDDYRRPQHDFTRRYVKPQSRFNSLRDINNRSHFERGYPRSTSANYTNEAVEFQNNQSFNPRCKSANDISDDRVRSRGLKRNSWEDDDSNDEYENGSQAITSYNSYSNLNGNSWYDGESYGGPLVKRRPSNNYGSDYSFGSNNYDASSVELTDTEALHSNDLESNEENVDFSSDVDEDESENDLSDVLDILSFPSEWSSCAVDKTGYTDISFSSAEGRSLHNFFTRTSHSKDFQLRITGVTRIESPFLHTMYLFKREEMVSRSKHVDELFLYHGTKREHLRNICEDNLNWRLFSNRHRFGKGVSFSPLATYSSHYSDNTVVKVMLLVKVLFSNAAVGSSDMTIPPDEQGCECDTSIKDDATVIVKYCDNEFYPLYKIMYTKHMNS